jgi:geranyl-CoA carboxylase beta subunit|tara:strand:+ start:1663 stop:1947 length:285 start_codon:yes stop_codon:yes gene_type:complete
MGGNQEASIMRTVMTASSKRRGQQLDQEKRLEQETKIIKYYDTHSDIFYVSGRVLDQDIIDSRHPKKALPFILRTCLKSKNQTLKPNSFGVARM